MNEISTRFRESIEFLMDNKIIKNRLALARRLGVTPSTLSMATTGAREPSLKMLLDYSEQFPISLDWLRNGKGDMVCRDRTSELLRKIERLEKENASLREQLAKK